tara:strand:+ start:20959 stop:21165 length:207 start_codon:yes stop_codon:yes gene_type:complete
MIRWTLSTAMEDAGVRFVKDLASMTGISYAHLTKLHRNQSKTVSMDTLNALCVALDCNVEALLEYVPE